MTINMKLQQKRILNYQINTSKYSHSNWKQTLLESCFKLQAHFVSANISCNRAMVGVQMSFNI